MKCCEHHPWPYLQILDQDAGLQGTNALAYDAHS
jgi:hypothetical protein